MCHKTGRYTSDLSDEQWAMVQPFLPVNKGAGRPIEIDLREAVNGMLYVAKTGCQWENMPSEFPHYQSIFYHYQKWCRDGTWETINRALRYQVRLQDERFAHPSAAIMDSQSVKTSERGGERGYDGNKKVKGRKRHILVDTLGLLLAVAVHSAQIQDREGAKLLLARLPLMVRLRLLKIWVDSAYKGDLLGWLYDLAKIQLEVVAPPPTQVGFEVLPKRWIVERTLAWFGHYRRLSKDYEHHLHASEGMVYLASVHMMLKRLAP